MSAGRDHRGRKLGLTGLTVAASALFALLIGGAFAVLLWAIDDANDSVSGRRASRTALVESGTMEQLLIDLETGQRGYVITHREEFLQPWESARRALPAESRRFLAGTISREQRQKAEEIIRGVRSFLEDYSVPLVEMVRRGEPAAGSAAEAAEGKRRVDTLRQEFHRYMSDERAQLAERTDAAGANSHQAILTAAVGLGASLAVVAAFTVLQHQAVVRPVRGCRRRPGAGRR
ncbi:CHASE3 domain-containing protein [Streptomyces sp. NPDC006743]|uniref:CHASE3 domain-containing protein n=1 Tax=Streptomyces sp. NPDC006743 TaxID=3154480 RepID=UPI003453D142